MVPDNAVIIEEKDVENKVVTNEKKANQSDGKYLILMPSEIQDTSTTVGTKSKDPKQSLSCLSNDPSGLGIKHKISS